MENQKSEKTVVLNTEKLQELENLVGDIPTRFGLPILDFLKKLYFEQNKTTQTPVVDIKKD